MIEHIITTNIIEHFDNEKMLEIFFISVILLIDIVMLL